MTSRKRFIGLASLVFILTPAAALTAEAMTLKEIMQGLRDDLVDISDGLFVDDFEQVARGAMAIAEHPPIPPAQVRLVAEELGLEMAAFKQLDTLVHELSLEINAAAEALDREAAVTGYKQIIDGCFGCHDAFKERVAAILSAP
ncbi:MAG: cytochrome c [Gammaproteobacteria bacterium]|nr:cytochrome c [Gammaproteobacteria bacterium]